MTLINNRIPTGKPIRSVVPKNTLAVAGFYGAGGANAGDNRALSTLVGELGGSMFGPTEKRRARNYLVQGATHKKTLLLFGYSRGGTSAIKLANILGRIGISLNHLVVFDAHSVFDNRTFYLRYDNVHQAHNFFQRNPRSGGRYGWWGRNPYWGSPLVSTFIQVQQIDFTGLFYKKGIPVSHLNIVRQALASL